MRTLVTSVFIVAMLFIVHADVTSPSGSVEPQFSSDSAEIQLQLGNLLFDQGLFVEALNAYQQALNTTNLTHRNEARLGVVQSALRLAKFDLARLEAETLVKAEPRNSAVLAMYADTLWASGFFDVSESTYRDALSIQPQQARAIHGIARSLMSRNQLDNAMAEAQKALRLTPTDAEIHHTIGAIYERMHRFKEAAVAYREYVNLLPNKGYSLKAAWSRAQIRFLQSFGGRTPYQMERGASDALYTLDFDLVDHKIMVDARINGRQMEDLVVDTGAESITITGQMARQAGVNPIAYTLTAGVGRFGIRGLQLARINSLEIGTLKLRNVPCLIKSPPLRNLPTKETESFSPLALGLSMIIDYKTQKLTIGRHLPVEPFDFELPLRLYRLATVQGIVGHDYLANFVIDTGGEVISISESTVSALGAGADNRRQIPLKVYGTSGWDQSAFLLPGIDLSFDAIQYTNIPVVVLNLDAPSVLLGYKLGGIVGYEFLSKYRVVIDLERSVLRLKQLT